MNAIINIAFPVQLTASLSKTPPAHSPSESRRPLADSVEISKFGEAIAQASNESTLRLAQIRAVRSEIENGTYENRERIDGTVERLLDVLA